MNRYYKTLELDKVLAMLAREATLADGARAAMEIQPSSHLEEVRQRLAETDAAARLMARFGAPSFGQATSVVDALRRAQAGASLSTRELLSIAETLRVIRSVAQWRKEQEGMETCLDERFSLLTPNKHLEQLINSAILSEEEIADDASPTLWDIRRKIRAASARVREQLDRLIHSSTYQKVLQEPIVTIRDGRFVVPVKSEHRSEIPGLIHGTSASGATVFVEPMAVVEANNEIRLLQSREAEEIERILADLSQEAGKFADSIIDSYGILVELNLIFAKAHLAYKLKGSLPTVTDSGYLKLNKARHPLIDQDKVVPVDIELGKDYDTLVITGPNTGGKTVALKTIGLLTLMTMCGLLPPVADGSVVSVFDDILADIGDEQSIEQSLSTFSAHMTNIIYILQKAGPRSLVLLDELGAGTDPVEGAALAIAILEQLRAQGAKIAATTHYAELKAYAIQTRGVENGSCEFDVATLRPTYRLLVGIPGRSNAFAICQRLGMDEELIQRARQRVSGEDQQLEEVVLQLDTRRQQLERELEQAQAARAKAQQAQAQAQAELAKLEKQRSRELDKARAEARRIVEQARHEAEQMLEQLDTLRKQYSEAELAARASQAKSSIRAQLRNLEQAIDPVEQKAQQKPYTLPRPLKAGDTVLLIDIDKKGTVLTPPEKDDPDQQVEVQVGIIKTRVPLSNLRLIEEKASYQLTGQSPKGAPSSASKLRSEARATRSAATEIDLRGMMTEEGVMEADRFIDNAVLMGLERITIIHGKGTGALRSAIHSMLRRHPAVKSFRLGVYGEGETGVTIVELGK